MTVKERIDAMDKSRLALIVMAAIIGVELVGVFVISGIEIAAGNPISIPPEMWDLARTTLALFSGVAGSMFLNGRVKNKEESNVTAQNVGKRPDGIHL